MRCGIFVNHNTKKNGRCSKAFCDGRGQLLCGEVRYREEKIGELRALHEERIELEARINV